MTATINVERFERRGEDVFATEREAREFAVAASPINDVVILKSVYLYKPAYFVETEDVHRFNCFNGCRDQILYRGPGAGAVTRKRKA